MPVKNEHSVPMCKHFGEYQKKVIYLERKNLARCKKFDYNKNVAKGKTKFLRFFMEYK